MAEVEKYMETIDISHATWEFMKTQIWGWDMFADDAKWRKSEQALRWYDQHVQQYNHIIQHLEHFGSTIFFGILFGIIIFQIVYI